MTVGARRVGVAMLGNAVSPLASFASAPLLTRVLGLEGRGDVASATSLLFLATAVATFGLPQAVTWHTARNVRDVGASLTRALLGLAVVGVIVSGLLIAFAPTVSVGGASVVTAMRLAALALTPTLIATGLQAAAAGLHAWRLVTIDRSVTATGRLVALLILAGVGALDVVSATVVLALSPALGALAYIGLPSAVRQRSRLPAQHLARDTISDRKTAPVRSVHLLRFGLAAWAGSLSGVLLARLDQALIAPLAGAEALGLYVVAVSVSDLPLVFTNAVRDVAFTSSSQGGDLERLASTARMTTLLSGILGTVVAVTAPWWLTLVFGSEFAGATPVIAVLIVAMVLGNPGSLAGVGLSAAGHPGLRSVSLGIAAAVNVVGLIVLVPTLGALGAALATVAGNIVAGNTNILFLTRMTGVPKRAFYGTGIPELKGVIVAGRT